MDSIQQLYVGLDYHKDSIQVCVMDADGRVRLNRACGNDAAAVVEAVGGRDAPVRGAAVEACTGAADFAGELAALSGWRVGAGGAGPPGVRGQAQGLAGRERLQ